MFQHLLMSRSKGLFIRLHMQKIVSVFFEPDKEQINIFDKNHANAAMTTFTSEDRVKLKSVLDEAKKSQKTFSAY